MNALLARTSPGTGKTRAVADAIRRHRVRTRVVTGNLTLARELSDEHGYALIEGRNPNNCQRYDVVEALGSAGHAVAGLACSKKSKPCYPYRGECAYWNNSTTTPKPGSVQPNSFSTQTFSGAAILR